MKKIIYPYLMQEKNIFAQFLSPARRLKLKKIIEKYKSKNY